MPKNNYDYDYDNYSKSLEKILSMTEKDYWVQYIDVNRHQVAVARMYLWVAAALIGAYATLYIKYENIILSEGLFVIMLFIISAVCAVFAFGLCLYSIPAREGYMAIPQISWGEFSKNAYDLLSEKKSNLYVKILTALIDNTDRSVHHNLKTNKKRAKLLRFTSWILVASFSFSLLSAGALFINSISLKHKKEITMTNDTNNTQNTSEATINKPTVEKPDVPVPAGPIGTEP